MPSVEAPRDTKEGEAVNQPTESAGARYYPVMGASRPNPPLLRGLLAGLNKLLQLSDFSRGDVFRD
ncbi:MAG TPA: hypothetical protein VMH81_17430 [Bryobacteraceae bacterium]|nr:hypothetical protein [Bryobacteraceae bacterium]